MWPKRFPEDSAALPAFAARSESGLALAIRVKAGAKRAGIHGVVAGPDGPRLALAVQAPAEKGRANQAVVALLAAGLGVRKSAVAVTAGLRGRDKRVAVEGTPVALTQALAAWLPNHARDLAPPSDEGAPP